MMSRKKKEKEIVMKNRKIQRVPSIYHKHPRCVARCILNSNLKDINLLYDIII